MTTRLISAVYFNGQLVFEERDHVTEGSSVHQLLLNQLTKLHGRCSKLYQSYVIFVTINNEKYSKLLMRLDIKDDKCSLTQLFKALNEMQDDLEGIEL